MRRCRPVVDAKRRHRSPVNARLIDDDDLAGLHIADVLRIDDIKRHRLGCNDERIPFLADRQRAEAVVIARGDEGCVREEDEGKCPLKPGEGFADLLNLVGLPAPRDQVKDDLRVASRLEDVPSSCSSC